MRCLHLIACMCRANRWRGASRLRTRAVCCTDVMHASRCYFVMMLACTWQHEEGEVQVVSTN